MICAICGSNDWHKTELHIKSNLQLCRPCGACFHEKEAAEEAKLRDYYRSNYRKDKIPTHLNITTTTNKKNYVNIFLREYLEGKKNLTIGDVGAATGYLLHHFKGLGHNVAGSTWEIAYRRFSEHYYGIPLAEELEPKHKYDLIIMYHTLEHMLEPDKKLERYRSYLKDDGVMLISTPEWFYLIEEWVGLPWQNFEHFFDPDHINVFSKQTLLNLFAKVGFEVVKEERLANGQTYLVKKCEPKPILPESWEDKLAWLKDVHKVDKLFREKKVKEALEVNYLFPDGHVNLLTDAYGKDREKQADYFKELAVSHPKNKRLSLAYCGWLYQGNQFQEAQKEMLDMMEYAPTADLCIFIAWTYSMLGDHKQAMAYFNWAANMNPGKWQECMDAICKEACMIPAWDERALEQLKEQLLQEHVKNLNPK